MRKRTSKRPSGDLRTFCGHAAREMHGLEIRLRTILAGTEPKPELRLLAETVESSLRIAQSMLRAGENGNHGALLVHRPLLRALSCLQP